MKSLIGKTITGVRTMGWDYCGDGERVGQLYEVTCSDGTVEYFGADGGDTNFYASLFRIGDAAAFEEWKSDEDQGGPAKEYGANFMEVIGTQDWKEM